MEQTRPKIVNCVLAGVGGQGILLATSLISTVAMTVGMDIKNNEVHGMAQRGGSVIAQIRFGEQVYSPLVKKGTADFLVALEIIEALRYADYLAPDGLVLASTQQIIPVTVSTGPFEYPKAPEELLKTRFPRLILCPCLEIATRLGESRAANVILVGLLSRFLPFPEAMWIEVLKKQIKSEFIEINLKAFQVGREYHDPFLGQLEGEKLP